MKIESAELCLKAQHEASSRQTTEVEQTLSFRQVFAGVAASEPDRGEELRRRVQRLLEQLVAAILAAIDGKKGEENPAADCAELPPETDMPGAGRVREVSWKTEWCTTLEEKEATTVCASGFVRTCDGREIAFDCSLAMQREHTETLSGSASGSYRLHDPLVLDFAGTGAELTAARVDFDLDADGKVEQIPGLGEGCGYLVFDRNGNGRADDGSELFGVASGNGFADLAKLDSDGNGWIDEADPAFRQLGLANGERYATLADRGVGALATAAVHAPFSLKTGENELLGQIRAAGIYLRESGEVGFMQQVDLAVSAPPAGQDEPGQRQQLSA